ncbi:MAG: AEC family transporter [Alphaproteobacteria bacterium]
MQTIIEVALPIFAIIAAGYGCGRAGVLGEASSEALNRYVYYVALPALFFVSTASAPLATVFNGPLIAAFMGGLALSAALAVGIGTPLFRLGGRERVLHGMAAIFSNTGYMGIPLLTALFGAPGILPAVIGTLCTGAVVMPLTMAALQLAGPAADSGETGGEAGSEGLLRTAGVVARNPLVVATALGVGWALAFDPGTLPVPATRFLDMLAVTAGPCALFAMGLFMVGRSITRGLAESLWLTLVKLVVQPTLTFALAVLVLDLDPFLTACAVILAGLPTGTLVFIVAQKSGIYVQRATATIIITTAVAVASLSTILLLFEETIGR